MNAEEKKKYLVSIITKCNSPEISPVLANYRVFAKINGNVYSNNWDDDILSDITTLPFQFCIKHNDKKIWSCGHPWCSAHMLEDVVDDIFVSIISNAINI